MVQSFTDGLPSRLGFDQGKKQRGAGGEDYYLEMCLWKHLCVQARPACAFLRACTRAAVANAQS